MVVWCLNRNHEMFFHESTGMEIAIFIWDTLNQEPPVRTGTNLTIQDYLRHNGLRPPNSLTNTGRHTVGNQSTEAFSRVLDERQAQSASRPRGLTIQDYLSKPVLIPSTRAQLSRAPNPNFHPPVTNVQPSEPNALSNTPEASHSQPAPPGPVSTKEPAIPAKDQIEASIAKAARRHSLPPELIRAVVRAESGYQVGAVSPAGAQGLMQLMPGTANEMGVADPFDIDQNIDGGSKYLRAMLDRFDGDVKLALSAYNAGPGTVARYNGNVPYPETRQYVERVMRFARLPSGLVKT